ncbi:uncharacterized protein LOC105833426 [Monomorium pharaonis]|uniref:uncharacterized protein LOC105833426 n=1 Tax=Monomorium pharaonis TaxID=307658 RepID=UPI00063FCC46|nr:uncharacterized protein LOC105833426 [Monomorium pharaonis]
MPELHVQMEGRFIQVRKSIKYLSVIIDSKWDFGERLQMVIPRVERMALSLSRIIPNLGRGGDWIDDIGAYTLKSLTRNKNVKTKFRRMQRRIAHRVLMSYRTLSNEVSMFIAKMLPMDLLKKALSYISKI